jgi:acetyltransferase-like isoleucine patch superfamily enzyme
MSINKKIGKSNIIIGEYTYGEENIKYLQWGSGNSCTIGKFCSIAPNVTFLLDGNHPYDWTTTYPFDYYYQSHFGDDRVKEAFNKWSSFKGPIKIGNDVWIGTGVTITHGVTIGDGAIIGTNALVIKDVEPYQIVGGVPAKLIRNRFDKEIVDLLLKLKWWEFDKKIIRDIVVDICQKPSKELLLKLISKYRNKNTL